MSRITSSLLSDTLNVLTLARETALARGGQAQAERLTPVVEQLRGLAAGQNARPAAPSGLLAEDEFQSLLAAVQAGPQPAGPAAGAADRGQVVAAMSAGGMGELDIARQLGLTREEVRLMLATDDGARPAARVTSAQVRGRYQS